MDAAFTPVDCLQQGGPITSSIFPASCKGGADWLIPVVVPRENYGNRTPRQEKARLDSVHDAVLEELRQTRRAEGKSYTDFPRDLPTDEGEKLLTRLSSGEVTLFNTFVDKQDFGANAGATRGLPCTPSTGFSVASAPGADKALFSSTLRSCAHLGAGLAVVWESTWGDAWWALWRANIDAFHEKGMDLLVLFSGDAKAGEANIGFAQSMEVLYLQERRVPFSTMAITDFKRYTQGTVLTSARSQNWGLLDEALDELCPGSMACRLRSICGGTALHVAAGCGAPASCLAALVRCGWDAGTKDDAGFTALHAAAQGSFVEEVERIAGRHFRNCPEQVAELLRLRADPKATSPLGMTPLHSAAFFSGSTEVVSLLLAARAAMEAKDTEERTPLVLAAWKGHREVVQLLLQHGADVAARTTNGSTALNGAAESGHAEVAQLLIQGRADVEARNSSKDTPLILAAWKGHPQVVALLLASHADVAAQTTRGITPLGFAASEGHTQVASLLLAARAAMEAKDTYERTPLYKAATNGHREVAELLVTARANLEAKAANTGFTPLSAAAYQGHADLVRHLLQVRAHPDTRDNDGETPWDLARGKQEVLDALGGRTEDVLESGLPRTPEDVLEVSPAGPSACGCRCC